MKTILFVCVHNAGRSQMAEAFTNLLAAERGLEVRGLSAGAIASNRINSIAAQVMEEIGIPLTGQHPKQITQDLANSAGRIVGMGCGVDSEACPAKFLLTEDWGLDDPAGQPIDKVRVIRDQIRERVERLLAEIEQGSSNDR